MTFSKKHTAIPLSLILICIIARGFLIYSMSIAPLAGFCKELAVDSLTDNPFELHYSIAYPKEIGLDSLSNNLLPFQPDFYQQAKNVWEKRSAVLSEIDPAKFKEEDAFLYRLLNRHVTLQLSSLNYTYYENPVSLSGGVHSQLPILLSEYAFRSKQDIENYFVLLGQIPDYLEGIGAYMQAREINGIYTYKAFLQETAAHCETLFPKEQIQNGTHFLQTGFEKRLEALLAAEIVTAEQADTFMRRNTALLSEKIEPAYRKLSEQLNALQGTEKLAGLSAYPKGKEYYALLLRSATGSDKAVKDIQSMLYKRYDSLYQAYSELSRKNTYVQNIAFPLEGCSAMLDHLCSKIGAHFPSLTEITKDSAQQVQLKKVDGLLAEMSAPAFYMTPPIDANDEHTIYINPDAQMETLDLYTTLAHEGFPGHLYQTVYSQTALQKAHAPLIRQLLYYGGYTEGWAVYAELFSYDYAAEACGENLADTILLTRLNRELQLCLCSILDIYIHYDGATLYETKTLLKNLGLNPAGAGTVYEAICDAPANYPKYYVGYLEILELKENARSLWGDAYSDMAFHKWLLEAGPADFTSLAYLLKKSSP